MDGWAHAVVTFPDPRHMQREALEAAVSLNVRGSGQFEQSGGRTNPRHMKVVLWQWYDSCLRWINGNYWDLRS